MNNDTLCIPMSAVTVENAAPEDYETKVLKFLDISSEIQKLQTTMRSMKREHDTLSRDILQTMMIMDAEKIKARNTILRRSESVGQQTLSIPLIRTVCDHIFAKPEQTEKFIKVLQEHRKQLAGKRIRLKLTKQKVKSET